MGQEYIILYTFFPNEKQPVWKKSQTCHSTYWQVFEVIFGITGRRFVN